MNCRDLSNGCHKLCPICYRKLLFRPICWPECFQDPTRHSRMKRHMVIFARLAIIARQVRATTWCSHVRTARTLTRQDYRRWVIVCRATQDWWVWGCLGWGGGGMGCMVKGGGGVSWGWYHWKVKTTIFLKKTQVEFSYWTHGAVILMVSTKEM